MKNKILCLLLCLVTALSFVGCAALEQAILPADSAAETTEAADAPSNETKQAAESARDSDGVEAEDESEKTSSGKSEDESKKSSSGENKIESRLFIDNADLFTASESADIAKALAEASDELGYDIVLVTTDSIGEKTPRQYADDYYDEHGYGIDGILMLVNMGERDLYYSTAGKCINIFTDYGLDQLINSVAPLLTAEEYADAATEFISICRRYTEEYNKGTPVDTKIAENGSYTTKDDVALYIRTYGRLPSNFITKKEAEDLGWSGGSLEPYAPGKCIGGSRFGNYEGLLPDAPGRTYTECDIDTLGAKSRGAKRIVFSNDGLIYYTDDHYESFTLIYGGDNK